MNLCRLNNMKFNVNLKQLVIPLLLMLLAGCRQWDNFTTFYNTFYNADRLINESKSEFEYQDEKLRINPRVFVPDPKITISDVTESGPPPFMKEFIISPAKLQPVAVKLDSVIRKGSKILAYHPKSNYIEGTLYLMASSFFYRNDWLSTQIKCSEQIDRFPDGKLSPDAHLLLSESLLIQKKLYAGKIMLSRTVDIAWQLNRYDILSEAFRLEADLALYQNDVEGALRPYKQAVAQATDKEYAARWQVELAAILYRLGRFRRAAEEFAKVHDYSPDYVTEFEAYLYYAASKIRLGQYEEADEILTRLERDGKYEEWLGFIYPVRLTSLRLRKEKNLEAAEKFADSAFATNPAVISYYFERGMDLFDSANYQKARVYFSKAKNGRTPVFNQAQRMYYLLNTWDAKKTQLIPDIYIYYKKKNEYDSLFAIYQLKVDSIAALAVPDTLAIAPVTKESIPGSTSTIVSQTASSTISHPGSHTFTSATTPDTSVTVNSSTTTLHSNPDVAGNRTSTTYVQPPPMDPIVSDSSRTSLATLLFELGRVHEQLGNADSSLYYYQTSVEVSPPSKQSSARFYYALARILKPNDPIKSDSLMEIIVNRYPLTDYGRESMSQLGYTESFVVDTVLDLFKSGCQLMKFGDNYFAINQFTKVYTGYPKTRYAPRSIYAIGWIYEKNLKNKDSALIYYQMLIEKYPGSEQAKDVMLTVNYMAALESGNPLPDSLKARPTVYMPREPAKGLPPMPLNIPSQVKPPQKKPADQSLSPLDLLNEPLKLFKNAKELIENPENLIKNPVDMIKDFEIPKSPIDLLSPSSNTKSDSTSVPDPFRK